MEATMTMFQAPRAVHEPTGQIYDAVDVVKGTLLRQGPWRCEVKGCAVQLHHKGPFLRVKPSGGEPSLVAPTFYCREKDGHDTRFEHPRPVRAARPGLNGDDSRLSIHRVRGFAKEPVAPRLPGDVLATAARTQYEYGDTVTAINGLLDFERQREAGEISLDDQLRFDGVNYFWPRFRYNRSYDDFRRLKNALEEQISRRPVYFIRGTVKYGPRLTDRGNEWILRLMSDPAQDGSQIEVRCFIPNTPEFEVIPPTLTMARHVDVFARKYLPERYLGKIDVVLREPTDIQIVPLTI